IGRSGGQWLLLSSPTPGAANAGPATLGSTANLKINEWMADPDGGNDWFELFNADTSPVDMAGLYLTDSPAIPGLTEYQVSPLSFIGARGFVKWEADDDPGQGRNHVSFNLDELGETLRLYTASLVLIDAVDFGLQQHGVSQGRFVDGANTMVSFPTTPTPGESNYLPLPNAIINEVLTHTDPPLEDAIELFNPTAAPASIGGWFLSNSRLDLKKFRLPGGTTIPDGGYLVIYENQFNSTNATTPFTLNSAHGDEVWLSQADGAGNLSGYRATVRFGAAANGVSFGRFSTSLGVEFTAMSNRTFGADSPATLEQFRAGTGVANAYAKVGPVVIHELMYHPPDIGGTNDDTVNEFIELKNIASLPVSLFDTNYVTNHWRLQDGVSFTFPPGATIAAGAYLLVVNFDPSADLAQLAAFRAKYGVSTNVPIFGPYGGKLDNGGESIELARPDTPQPADGFVPYILVDRVNYSDHSPWPSGADGNTNGIGVSLQRREASNYGNEPLNWQAGVPTPGAPNGAPLLTLPTISQQPQNTGGAVGTNANFSVTASGGAPLTYQWRFNGVPLSGGATNSTLALVGLQSTDEGAYTVFVSNPAGSVLSDAATLTVQAPPTITQQPQTQAAAVGANVTFTVVASGGGLTYQWRFNGTNLVGQTNSTLTLTNVQITAAGPYSVLVANTFNTTPSAIAYLVMTPPGITAQPQSRTVNVGSNVTFSVTATGDAPLGYQWRRNGVPLNGTTATNATLLLPNAQNSDGGSYTVVVFNPSGSVTSAVATLNFFLQITQQPVSASVNPGTNVTFSVSAIGTGPLRYQWKFNGSDLAGRTSTNLPLTNVQLADNGDYTVVVTDDIGSVTSQAATLTVLVRPALGLNPVSQTVAAGTPVTFLTSAYGTLPLSFRWRKAPPGGSTANLTNIIVNQTNCFLTIASVTNADAGTYTVTVTNVAGSATLPNLTTNCYLTVVVPPLDQIVAPGSNATFSARVSGPNGTSCPLAFQWRFNGTNIPGATSTNLTVTNVQASAVGPYTFVVTNGYCTATGFTAMLALIPPPQLSQPQMLGDGSFQLLFNGFSNRSYFIEISTNLVDWTNAATLNYSNGLVPWVDATATTVPYRFYRGRLVP
ncbi:MAG TPA: immunoglobulin domain-containing protein, partial [Verrucomicrobiae bacterium]